MTMIAVVNGPNLNLLGSREPDVYGTVSLAEINESLAARGAEQGIELEFFHSNHEGAIIDHIQGLRGHAQGMIINPGALAHYSYALRDALAAVQFPVVEVHISNIHAREAWRSTSVITSVVSGVIAGLGPGVYDLALQYLAEKLGESGREK